MTSTMIMKRMIEEELNEKFSIDDINALRLFISSPADPGPYDTIKAAHIISRLAQNYIRKNEFTKQEKTEILQDALNKLNGIYFHKSRKDLRLLPGVAQKTLLKLKGFMMQFHP